MPRANTLISNFSVPIADLTDDGLCRLIDAAATILERRGARGRAIDVLSETLCELRLATASTAELEQEAARLGASSVRLVTGDFRHGEAQ